VITPDCNSYGVIIVGGRDSLFLSAVRREDNHSTLVLDFTDVPYIDSTALGTLVSTYVSRHRLGRQIALSDVSGQVSKTLKITKVEPFFLLFPTLEDALTRFDEAAMLSANGHKG
jgi:anti-anti-sigma factor